MGVGVGVGDTPTPPRQGAAPCTCRRQRGKLDALLLLLRGEYAGGPIVVGL